MAETIKVRPAEMLPIYQPDIHRLHQTGRRVTEVWLEPVTDKGRDSYAMFMTVEGVNEPMQLVNQRGLPRFFREEKTALAFVRRHVPDVERISIKLGQHRPRG